MIEYGAIENGKVKVKLDGKHVGDINQVANGWQYKPKGSKMVGEVMPSLRAIMQSLESDD